MQISTTDYLSKFQRIVEQTQFNRLSPNEQEFVKKKALELRFTQQELRLVSDMALDRMRWKEPPLSTDWPVQTSIIDGNLAKKQAFSAVLEMQEKLREKENDYDVLDHTDKPKTQKPILKIIEKTQLGLGRCPVASEKTRCCNLLTLDAVEKCGFDCSYCSIQSFYHDNEVVFDRGFADKLSKLVLDRNETYHIGTGQSSDSLMWGNHQGVLEALCDFADRHPNVILELKTKSKNIGWLLKNNIPKNIICTWSLNPQAIIDCEEHNTASLEQRLEAAKALAEKGGIVGFHFHPIIQYKGWYEDYRKICQRLMNEFRPDQVAMISMGTLTFTKSVMNTIRNRDLTSKILQIPLESAAGKLSYPKSMKIEMFRNVYNALDQWHEKVFFYLCMESQELWEPVLGFGYANNKIFEAAMKKAYFEKVNAVS